MPPFCFSFGCRASNDLWRCVWRVFQNLQIIRLKQPKHPTGALTTPQGSVRAADPFNYRMEFSICQQPMSPFAPSQDGTHKS